MSHLKVFFTGASSFSGYWFCHRLLESGHQVTATFTRGGPGEYEGTDRERVERLLPHITPVWGAPSGSDAMLEALAGGPFGLLCLHAATVGDYKSENFDVLEALRLNTCRIDEVLHTAKQGGVQALVTTGSYFEADTGAAPEPRQAFSPYALSKTMTWQAYRFMAGRANLPLGKFIISNPFGPLEKGGFTSYLARTWLRGEVAECRTPDYLRDNIPVDLMAIAYADFCERMFRDKSPVAICDPSGYVGSQGEFARLFAGKLQSRWGVPCEVRLAKQEDFNEPLERANTTNVLSAFSDWSELASWDQLADYYLKIYST